MVEDPNESARRAFGEGPTMPPPPAAATTPLAPTVRSAGALAEWGTRAAAFVLDSLFLFGVVVLVTIVAVVAVGSGDERTIETIAYAVGLPLGFLYAPLLMARRGKANGQTFGKQMMDIRVVRTNGEQVTFWNGFLRQVIGQQLLMAMTLYVYGLLDYLWPLRDARNQALHDKIAKTLVVRTAPSPTLPQPLAAGSSSSPPPSPRRVDESPVGGWLPPASGD
jgi:uncharacterized RDD family membrane protein YckC